MPYFAWEPTFTALVAANLCVLRYDLYGRGYSDRPDVVYDLDLFDRQLEHLVAALGLTGMITPIGLSMGGAIAVTFADRQPDRVHQLVLIDPLVSAPTTSLTLRLVSVPGVGERVMNWFGDQILVGGQAQDFYRPECFPEYQEWYRLQMRYRGFKQAILSTLRSLPGWDIAGAYERVGKRKLPVLLFWGQQDKTIPFDTYRQVQAAIPHVEFYAIEEAGHVPHYERPDLVNPLLIEYLRR